MARVFVPASTLFITTLMLVLVPAVAETVYGPWKMVWTNPRLEPRQHVDIVLLPTDVFRNRGYAEADGGYTVHVYFKKGPWIWWRGRQVGYDEFYALFARKVVDAWNASLKFAAENFEWGRHLSKLRLKFYTDENKSQSPGIDVVIDPTRRPDRPDAFAATISSWPIEIVGNLDVLSFTLAFALGWGGATKYNETDWRGWNRTGVVGPDHIFMLEALSVRWRSLKYSTSGSRIEFPSYDVIRVEGGDRIKPYASDPGVVWAYYYSVFSEVDGVEKAFIVNGSVREGGKTSVLIKPVPTPLETDIWIRLGPEQYPMTVYGGTICIHPFDWMYQIRDRQYMVDRSPDLPLLRLLGNDTALLMHGIELHSAIVNGTWRWMGQNAEGRFRNVWVPLKYFTRSLLDELSADSDIRRVDVIDSLEPAMDKVSKLSYRDGRVCLEGLKDRVLVEMKFGRAYKVGAPVEPVAISGKTHRDGNGVYWILRGSEVFFKPLNNSFSPAAGVRYVWKGLNETIKVNAPINMENPSFSRLWRKQYLVEVDSPYRFEGVGWFDEGSKAFPRPVGGYVDLGNGTRLVLKGFTGYDSAEVVVDKPLKLKPVWDRMYRVDVVSRYVSGETRYIKEGETAHIQIPRQKDFGNGSKVELVEIKAQGPAGEVLASWDGVSDDGQQALFKFTVNRPTIVKVGWKLYHRVTVSSQVNSYVEWVLNGTVHRLNLPEKKEMGRDILLVLREITVNGKPLQGFELLVTSPTSVEAAYQRKLMVTLMVEAGGGRLVEPEEIVLARDGETEIYRPPSTYIGEALWKVVKITYLGGDVATEASIDINTAGTTIVPSKLRTVTVSVVDVIGMPIPYATVTARNTEGVTETSGTTILSAIPPWDFEAKASHPLGSGVVTIRPGERTAIITAGISPYTLAILAIAAAAGTMLWRKRTRLH